MSKFNEIQAYSFLWLPLNIMNDTNEKIVNFLYKYIFFILCIFYKNDANEYNIYHINFIYIKWYWKLEILNILTVEKY